MAGAGGKTLTRKIKYAPLPSQRQFHKSEARFKGFSGPIGSGKSQALCHEAIKLSYVNAGRTGLIGAPTFPMLRDATQAALVEILNANGIAFELNRAEMVLTVKETRSRILLRSLEDFERLRGTNLAWFGVDELTYTQEEAWLRLEGRLRDPKAKRLCGFGVWTPKGFDWVYRRFLRATVDGYETVLAKPYENRHVLEQIPDFYDRLKSSYDARFFEQEVLGEYLNVSAGLVYASFERARNVKATEADARLPLLWALDFNVDPMSSVIAQKDGEEIRVLDEIVLRRASTWDACEEFYTRFGDHEKGVTIYGDASGARMQTAGTTDYEMVKQFFAKAGYRKFRLKVPAANPGVRDRVLLLNSKFQNAAGETRLAIDPKCQGLIQDFEEVTYKPDSSAIDKDRDPQRTHLSDALGYLVWQECRPQAKFGERERRLF